MLNHFSIFLLC